MGVCVYAGKYDVTCALILSAVRMPFNVKLNRHNISQFLSGEMEKDDSLKACRLTCEDE